MRDIMKEEIQKCLEAGFIYPILDNEWVSLCVIAPKKNRKWWFYVDYMEINKATWKDQFPFSFINQVLDKVVSEMVLFFHGLF